MGTFASNTFGVHEALSERAHPIPAIEPQLRAKHIKSIKPHKAVLKDSAPAAAWTLCAEEISESLSSYLATVDTQPVPAGLLRPLGILRPDAKGVAGAAREMLTPDLQAYVREIPQFACFFRVEAYPMLTQGS